MAKENSDGGFRRLTQVRLQEPRGISVTSNLGDFSLYVVEQLSEPHRIFLSQPNMQIQMDYTGQIFFKPMSGLDIFEQIRRRSNEGGENL